jgi:ERCC4-related helicase
MLLIMLSDFSSLSFHESYLQQEEIFDNFAIGVFNLLIATKSIEDLDVPKASVVIR